MRQLPLEVQLADYAVFDSFFVGENAAAVFALRSLLRGGQAMVWLWGNQESGKSHLLQALVAEAASQNISSAYLPLADAQLRPEMLEGMGALDLLCIDDVQDVAGDPTWEAALFRLYEDLFQSGGRLVVAANVAPGGAGFALRDLGSRLASGATFRLHGLSDEESLRALQKRAGWRGLDLPEETAMYLLTRVQRSPSTLFVLLDRLDKEALVAQRRLTVPFVRQVLDELQTAS
jgi:DnaA-homolog protein